MPATLRSPAIGWLLLVALTASPALAQSLTAYPAGSLIGIVGRPVTDSNGMEIGLIGDILVDQERRPRVVVLNAGGFLGVGIRQVAVAWQTLRFVLGDGEARIVETLPMDEVAAAPEYKGPEAPIQALSAHPTEER